MRQRVVVTAGGPRRRVSGLVPILAIIAVLATGGAIAAKVSHAHNLLRLALFQADPLCGAASAEAERAASTRVCTVGPATVSARWVHVYKGSRYFRLALAVPDGAIDSVELKGATEKAAWNAATPGSPATITRFVEALDTKPHVTRVTAGGLTATTSWSPEWRNRDTDIGIWFLGLTAGACIVALLWIRARRTTTNLGEPFV